MLGLDAVAEVNVVGAPDERLGERAAAVVRVRDGMDAPTLDDVRRHFGGRRPGPAEVARVALRGRRLPAHRVGQGPEVQAAPGPPRRTARRFGGVRRRERGRRAADPSRWRPTRLAPGDARRAGRAAPARSAPSDPVARSRPAQGAQRARHARPVPEARAGVPHVQRPRAVRDEADHPAARAARAAGGGGAAVRLRVEAARRAGGSTPASPPTRSTASPTRPTRPSGRRSSGRCSRRPTS